MPERPHRWVLNEPDIPFDMPILYEDSRIIVVDKPHFLATTPRGMWYRSTALIRLREMSGENGIAPAHRLDRATAGVLVFVRDPAARGAYQMLFQEHRVRKTYECLAPVRPVRRPVTGTVAGLNRPRPFPLLRRSHIVKDRGRLQAFEVPGRVNAETRIESAADKGPVFRSSSGLVGAYTLHPRTGKTHQLRVHMNSLGLPIVGDDLYPRVLERPYDDFSNPLQLVARSLAFVDPYSGHERLFFSSVPLGFVSNSGHNERVASDTRS